jgi:hypothetical protein
MSLAEETQRAPAVCRVNIIITRADAEVINSAEAAR